jgi:polygalacturonase
MINRRSFMNRIAAAGAGTLLSRVVSGEVAARSLSNAGADDPWAQVPEILKRIKPPAFPKRDFLITRFGAIADGVKDCTDAFRKAIATCNKAGGGRVVVPEGTFLTGAIHLMSNVNLHVVAGATIKFSTDTKKYLPLVFTRYEGVELMNYSPFIYAFGQKNIALTGDGTIDGQGGVDAWWKWVGRAEFGGGAGKPDLREDRKRLFEMAEQNVPVDKRVFGEGHYLRTQFIQPYRCENVLIEGITIRNSPMWEIHPVLCHNVTVRKVKISSQTTMAAIPNRAATF